MKYIVRVRERRKLIECHNPISGHHWHDFGPITGYEVHDPFGVHSVLYRNPDRANKEAAEMQAFYDKYFNDKDIK